MSVKASFRSALMSVIGIGVTFVCSNFFHFEPYVTNYSSFFLFCFVVVVIVHLFFLSNRLPECPLMTPSFPAHIPPGPAGTPYSTCVLMVNKEHGRKDAHVITRHVENKIAQNKAIIIHG